MADMNFMPPIGPPIGPPIWHNINDVPRHDSPVFATPVERSFAEKLVVMNCACPGDIQAICVYSFRDRTCYQLPPIPHVESGIPWNAQCITLFGKIYVLGGLKSEQTSTPDLKLSSDEVYMLDVAGAQEWKSCASMNEARQHFGCSIVNGKIFVCGGTSLCGPVCGTEVYDPILDIWSPLIPLPSVRLGHEVLSVGDEILVYRGSFYDSNFEARREEHLRKLQSSPKNDSEDTDAEWEYAHRAARLEVYNATHKTWRTLPEKFVWNLANEFAETLFTSDGKLHSVNQSDIFVFDIEQNSKDRLHSCLFQIGPEFSLDSMEIDAVVQVNSELVALFRCKKFPHGGAPHTVRGLLQSIGFSGPSSAIAWEVKAHWELVPTSRFRAPFIMRILSI